MGFEVARLVRNDAKAAAVANWLAKTSRTPVERRAAFAVKNARLSAAVVTLSSADVDLSYHGLPRGGQSLVVGLPDEQGGRVTLHTFLNLLTPPAQVAVVARIGWPPSNRLTLQTA